MQYYGPGIKSIEQQLGEEIIALQDAENNLNDYLFDFSPLDLRLKLDATLKKIGEQAREIERLKGAKVNGKGNAA